MREEEALAFSPIWISTLVLLEKSYLAINYVKIRKYYLKSLVFSIIRKEKTSGFGLLLLKNKYIKKKRVENQPLFCVCTFR